MKPLDFIVIGASKSGTTSLHHYLSKHPDLWLPPEKDVPFFSDEAALAAGWEAAGPQWFAEAPPDRLWGTVTPRYMDHAWAAERISAAMPRVKLVAILRNPVDRALSQYRQQVRRGKEVRSFADAVRDQLEDEALQLAREGRGEYSAHEHRYVALGEYDRILSFYFDRFPAEQILVVFNESLRNNPLGTFDQVVRHLGATPGVRPENLGRTYHRGGDRERLSWLVPFLRRIAPLRWLWRLLPARRRRVAFTRFFTRWSVVGADPEPIDVATRAQLVRFYAEDVAALEKRLGVRVPWDEFDA